MINVYRIPFDHTGLFSKLDVDYDNYTPSLREFCAYHPGLDSFEEAIRDKSAQKIDRELLVEVIQSQYATLDADAGNASQLLNDKHFTVSTAHQPSLFTGPLYFIYKIVTAIQTARLLDARFKQYKFHPVFVLGGEDHDFEEINSLQLFNKTLKWKDPAGGNSATGRMDWKSLQSTIDELFQILGDSEEARELKTMINRSFKEGRNYGQCMQSFIIELFRDSGLIVLNMDDKRLKKNFAPIIREELLHRPSQKLIEGQQEQLDQLGYKAQALAREINLFYLTDTFRERIEWKDGHYHILNQELRFTEKEILREIDEYPERFSPNVCLRPLYQEFSLPNLAYIGGGGEIAYWLERKTQFEHFGINFPMLIRRNSVLWIEKNLTRDMQAFGLRIKDIFKPGDDLIRAWLLENSGVEIEYDRELSLIEEAYNMLSSKAETLDPTLAKAIEAEKVRQLKSAEQLGKRLIRAEKSNQENSVNKIQKLKDRLFPNGGLQERQDNFIPFYLKYGWQFFHLLSRELSPFDKGLIIIQDHNESGNK